MELIRKALSTPKNRQELLKVTGLPDRTLRYNLSILKRQDVIKEIIVLSDMRKKIFSLNGDSK